MATARSDAAQGISASSRPVPAIQATVLEDIATFDAAALAPAYAGGDPFPHIVIDDALSPDVLRPVIAEIAASEVEQERQTNTTFNKRRTSDVAKLGPATRRLIDDLNSAPFLIFLEKLTGIDALVPDPHLEGGGVHQIGAGGFLKVHTDFNWHRRLQLHRRINVLLYLNENWDEAWGGQLELWDKTMSRRGARIAPIFNRMVVFSTTDESYHGHPDPMTCPDGVTRNSIALYYYTSERPKSEMRFGESVMTNYRARPDEAFQGNRLKYLLNQAEIRSPLLRKLIQRFRG